MPNPTLLTSALMSVAPAKTTTLRPFPSILPPAQKTTDKRNATRNTPKEIFICDEESHFYSQCLEKLVLKRCRGRETVLEFGSGDGGPVIASLSGSSFQGTVHGFEINERAAAIASKRAAETGMKNCYQIHNTCFFTAARKGNASFLIANPPYIPAPDNCIMMPALHGGPDGAGLTRELMSLGVPNVMLLLSSYSNPVATLRHAQREGYRVLDFMVTAMPFGTYSSEPRVKTWIAQMKSRSEAFYTESCYLLAGVLLSRRPLDAWSNDAAHDLTDQLLSVLTALR